MPFKAALLSSALQATAGVFVFLIAQAVLKQLGKKTKTQTRGRSHELVLLVLGTLLVQTNILVWQYALLSEVFALTCLFVTASVFLWLQATFSAKRNHLALAAFVWGLGTAHHYLVLGLFPMVITVLHLTWKKRRNTGRFIKQGSLILASFLMGFGISQVLLWWRLSRQALISWVFAPTLQGWWHFVSRGLYSGTLADGSQSVGLFAPVVLSDAIKSVSEYVLQFIPTHIGIPTFLLALGGIVWLLRRHRSLWTYGLLMTTLLMTFGVVTLLALPASADSLQRLELLTLVERMYLPGYLLLGLFVPLGLVLVNTWVKEKFKRVSSLIVVIPVILFLVLTAGLNGKEFTHLKSGYRAPQQVGFRLVNLPQNSVVLCFSDLTCFTTMYYLSVEKLRPDIQLVPVSEQLRFAAGSQHVSVRYPDNPLRLSYVAAEALAQGKPVFVSQVTPLYDQIWNLNHTFTLDSQPIFKEMVCGIAKSPPELAVIKFEPAPPPTRLSSVLYQRSFIASETNGFHGALDCPQAAEVAQQAMECSAYSCQLQRGLLATMLDPYNSSYRSMLAGFYELQHFAPLAIREYQLAYTLDASNATAAAALTRLDQSQAYPIDLSGL